MAKYNISVQENRKTTGTFETNSEDIKNHIVKREKKNPRVDAIFVNDKMIYRKRK